MASDANTPASMAASLAGPLRAAAWVCWGVAASFLAAIVAIAITEEEAAPLVVLFAPAVPFAIGLALRYAARGLETGSGPELPTLAAWGFALFGAPLLAGGIVGAWDALARIALILLGAGFLGAGWLAHRHPVGAARARAHAGPRLPRTLRRAGTHQGAIPGLTSDMIRTCNGSCVHPAPTSHARGRPRRVGLA